MPYTKYESSGHCSFRQEDFWKLHFEQLFLTPWPTYATNWNSLNTFDRGLPRDHSCEVWSKSNEWFQGRSCLKKLTDGRTHQSRRTMDNGPSQKLTLSRWAKKAHIQAILRYIHCDDAVIVVQLQVTEIWAKRNTSFFSVYHKTA